MGTRYPQPARALPPIMALGEHGFELFLARVCRVGIRSCFTFFCVVRVELSMYFLISLPSSTYSYLILF
jgi:hypothetical protein